MATTHPLVKWAQRKDAVFVTVETPDVIHEHIDLSATHLKFSGQSSGKEYTFALEFAFEVDPSNEDTKYMVKPRCVYFHIKKKEAGKWWPTLLKDKKAQRSFVSTDWGRYVDEEEEKEGFDMSGMSSMGDMGDMGGMGGMGGMPGMGGMGGMPGMGGLGGMPGMGGMPAGDNEGSDSDDEPLPDLTPDKPADAAPEAAPAPAPAAVPEAAPAPAAVPAVAAPATGPAEAKPAEAAPKLAADLDAME